MIDMIPQAISELQNLSVLNISGNAKISDLPAQMGLLTKLWNLNTRGCSLHEPLATMMTSKTYKTSDVIGYLRYFFVKCRFTVPKQCFSIELRIFYFDFSKFVKQITFEFLKLTII